MVAEEGIDKPLIFVDPDVLRKHVEALSERFVPRSDEYPKNLAKVADYIATSFRASGTRVNEQEFEVYKTRYKNIIAEYGPPSSEILVVGAHYDTAGEQPGADDNASGVAGLLEIGRLLAQDKLGSRVVLAAYALEEPPNFRTENMGSTVHARSLKESGVSVKLMISLEMIGYFSEKKNSQSFPIPFLRLFYPSQGNFILVVDQLFSNQARGLKKWMSAVCEIPVYSINAPAFIPGVDFSDHQSFWKYGYPAVMVTDTAFYRNEAYHSSRDTADRLDYRKMAQVVYGVYSYVKQAAQEK
jgi:Zn-dependent M28 family amino/carboxypeptidase